MKFIGTLISIMFMICLASAVVWMLNLGDVVQATIASGHLLDWVMGALCLIWLVIILKVPWDLYFQAHSVLFELERSKERSIPAVLGREDYLRVLRKRLGWLAVGSHIISALIIAAITYFTGGAVGYYFAVFYLVSTLFRPSAAGYAYLAGKLKAIAEEVRYPREDVVELRDRVRTQDQTIHDLTIRLEQVESNLVNEENTRAGETHELRENVHDISREFETTVSRLTDNQEVIRGIQAFVRLISQSTHS